MASVLSFLDLVVLSLRESIHMPWILERMISVAFRVFCLLPIWGGQMFSKHLETSSGLFYIPIRNIIPKRPLKIKQKHPLISIFLRYLDIVSDKIKKLIFFRANPFKAETLNMSII